MPRVPVVSIFGPTAIGKTEIGALLSQRLADCFSGVTCISADAYAVYRELPIITGAPTPDQGEWATVGSLSVRDEWSAGAFAAVADPLISNSLEANRIPLLVGGTGLYLQAALCELDLREPVSDEIRTRIRSDLEERGPEALHAELARVNPDAAGDLSEFDSQRITRALEAIAAGNDPAPGNQLWTSRLKHPTLLFGLSMDRETLRSKISDRVDRMLELGAVQEVENAWQLGPSRTASAAIGMEELKVGDIERMKVRTRRFAKRQETWMRKLENATVIDVTGRTPEDVAEQIFEAVSVFASA
jgi:tRNA dimethylallyltransferase